MKLDIDNISRIAELANQIAGDERYSDRVKHWQAKAAEIDPDNMLNLNGANLGALALRVGLDTPQEEADLVFDNAVKILYADTQTSFQDVLDLVKKKDKPQE